MTGERFGMTTGEALEWAEAAAARPDDPETKHEHKGRWCDVCVGYGMHLERAALEPPEATGWRVDRYSFSEGFRAARQYPPGSFADDPAHTLAIHDACTSETCEVEALVRKLAVTPAPLRDAVQALVAYLERVYEADVSDDYIFGGLVRDIYEQGRSK